MKIKSQEEMVPFLLQKITDWQGGHKGEVCTLAIDGRSASGKSTLAGKLQNHLSCSVVHMDHFFLRPKQRTRERLKEPGGNIDRERFTEEVLLPLQSQRDFSYRIFDCHTMKFSGNVTVRRSPVIVIEGVYSCHPNWISRWDITAFISVDTKTQLRRIEKRNGKEQTMPFVQKWIPMEEQYFKCFSIENRCDYSFFCSEEKI